MIIISLEEFSWEFYEIFPNIFHNYYSFNTFPNGNSRKFIKLRKRFQGIFLGCFSKNHQQKKLKNVPTRKMEKKNSIINLGTSSTNQWKNSQNIHHFALEISKENKSKIESFFSNSSSSFSFILFFFWFIQWVTG